MEFSEVIKKRRSIRQFTEDRVTGEQIMRMLDAAVSAPNACNMQSWHFYVVTDGSVKRRMSDEKVMSEWAATAPVIFVVCTVSKKIVERFGERGKVFTVQDTAAAVENLLLCAADMGLGGCFMGAFNREKCCKILGIDESHEPVAMVPVGKPAVELPARPRNPIDTAVTFIGDNDGAESISIETEFRHYEVKNATLPDSVFDNLDLRRATFHNINLHDSSFDDINLSGTKFSDINMSKCSYGGLTTECSKFGCVDFRSCEFDNTQFDGAVFRSCTFKGVRLENCDIEGLTADGEAVKKA